MNQVSYDTKDIWYKCCHILWRFVAHYRLYSGKKKERGELNKALEVCQKALQIFDRIEDQRGVATAYHQSLIPLNHQEQKMDAKPSFL